MHDAAVAAAPPGHTHVALHTSRLRLPCRVTYHKDELHNVWDLPAPLKAVLGLPTPLLSTLLHI